MTVAVKNLGISSCVYSTVLPRGASIGKDGTAMYVGLLSIFSLQAFGAPIDAGVLAIVLLTGALAAFGTAPVPSASLFMLAAVLSAVGVPPEQTALIVGFVLRSEEHTSELQSLMRISSAVFCLKQKIH